MRRLRAGETVEIRSAPEILATLDERGQLEGLPFMPEMLKYCGHKVRVFKRADKTCDTIDKSGIRRMLNTVHLEGLRCDGGAHAGCQASCLLFWKEAWLKRGDQDAGISVPSRSTAGLESARCTMEIVERATRKQPAAGTRGGPEVFSCQATELLHATSPLNWWDPRQYVRDLWSGNVGLGEMLKWMLIAMFNCAQRLRRGGSYPSIPPSKLDRTPILSLGLQSGELVRVKAAHEIAQTLDSNSKNRGLWFDAEMVPYCEGTFKVLKRVEKIINEKTGELMHLPNPCIILEGVMCRGHLSRNRLFCPRGIFPFWREIWLRRANVPER